MQHWLCATMVYKKLSYRLVTARCILSVVILPITTQQCRNRLMRQVLTKPMVWSWRFSWSQCVRNKRRRSSCVYHLYTDDLLWRNFLSPPVAALRRPISCFMDNGCCMTLMYGWWCCWWMLYDAMAWPWPRPLRKHSLITRLRHCMADRCTKFEVSSVSRCGEITRGVKF